MLWLLSIIKVLAAYIGNMVNLDIATPDNQHQPSVNTASTECQQIVNDFGCCNLCNARAVLWHLPIIEVFATFRENMVRVDLATPKNERHQSISRVSTILGVPCCIIQGLCYGIYT